MAGIFRSQGGGVARALLLAFLFVICASLETRAQLYEQPVLIIEPGMHTAAIKQVGADAAGRIAVTGAVDKTVRVWSLPDGKLLRTIRIPAGPEDIGKIFTVAVHPDGALVAVGGWTQSPEDSIYVFETQTGKMVARIAGLPCSTNILAFSTDGRYLAVGLSGGCGLRIYDRNLQWSEVSRDTDYGDAAWGVTFSADGRLATASYDGKVRLYDRAFKLIVPPKQLNGRLYRIDFSPDGASLAVGNIDAPAVHLLDGHSLAPLQGPNLDGLNNPDLGIVAWSKDGKTLYAGGLYWDGTSYAVLAWADAGRGARRALPIVCRNAIAGLAALPDGRLLVAAQDPLLGLLEPDGRTRWAHASPKADFRGQQDRLAVSTDGTIVDFEWEWGESPLRFDLRARKLSVDPSADQQTILPKQSGLALRWRDEPATLDGKPLGLAFFNELSRSLAIDSGGNRFVLGAEWSLQAFDAKGQPIWRRSVPSGVWAVNISGDGRLAIAAYGDGTIRWHRLDDGRELLALYVLADKQNWVAWTPEGFYGATAGAFSVLQWQVNRGVDAAADTVPVNAIPRLRQPDALPFVLQELETARALGIAALKAARRDVQIASGAPVAPGARLFVLTIGVKDYGDRAKDLALEFADRDARDIANALLNTQEGGLYALVIPQFLSNETATKGGIFDALTAMERSMAGGTGQDLALVMFSGHGTMIDDQLYVVPNGADNSTPGRLKASSISATEFQDEIAKLAKRGRVLVLLDACHSAGLIGALPASNVLKSILANGNVTVLTSTKTADKRAKEYEKWGHGAFTKALLDALSASDDVDTNHDSVISMSELTAYMQKHLSDLTDGDQQLGLDQRFQGDIFVVGL